MHLGTKIREVLYSIRFSILVHRSLGFWLWNMKLIVPIAPVLVTKIAFNLINHHHLIHLTLLNLSVKLLLNVIFFSQLIMIIGIILTIEKFYYWGHIRPKSETVFSYIVIKLFQSIIKGHSFQYVLLIQVIRKELIATLGIV